jgi:hypothetical protein
VLIVRPTRSLKAERYDRRFVSWVRQRRGTSLDDAGFCHAQDI